MGLSVQYRFDTESRRIMADQLAEKIGYRSVDDAISAVFKSIMKKPDNEGQCILDCDTHSIYAMFEKNPLNKSISILGFNVEPRPQKAQPNLRTRQIIVRPPSSGPSTPSIHSSDFFSAAPSPDAIRPGHMRVTMDILIPPLQLPKANICDIPPLFYGLSPINFKTPMTISVQFAQKNQKPPEQVKQAPTIALIEDEKEQEPSNTLQVGKRQFFLSSINIEDRELLAACLKQKTNCLNRKEKQKNLKPFVLYFRDDAHYKMLKIGVKHTPDLKYPFRIYSKFLTDNDLTNKMKMSETRYEHWKKQQPALPGN